MRLVSIHTCINAYKVDETTISGNSRQRCAFLHKPVRVPSLFPSQVDVCCPPRPNLSPDLADELLRNVSRDDPVPRVPCDMDPLDFYHDYVMTRTPVYLTGCAEDWPARNWTVRGVLARLADVKFEAHAYLHQASGANKRGDLERR